MSQDTLLMNPLQKLRHDPVTTLTRWLAMLISIVLWGIAAALSMMTIFAMRELIVWGFADLLRNNSEVITPMNAFEVRKQFDFVYLCLVVVMGLGGLIVVVGSLDYVFRKAGEWKVIRNLLLLIIIEAAIVVPVALNFW